MPGDDLNRKSVSIVISGFGLTRSRVDEVRTLPASSSFCIFTVTIDVVGGVFSVFSVF